MDNEHLFSTLIFLFFHLFDWYFRVKIDKKTVDIKQWFSFSSVFLNLKKFPMIVSLNITEM